jgi:hypothetical protein
MQTAICLVHDVDDVVPGRICGRHLPCPEHSEIVEEVPMPRCATCGGALDPDQADAPTASGRLLCDADWWLEEVVNKGPVTHRAYRAGLS